MAWTNKQIKSVLNENYNRGVNGKDYEEIVPELENILWLRIEKQEEKETKRLLKEREEYELYLEDQSEAV